MSVLMDKIVARRHDLMASKQYLISGPRGYIFFLLLQDMPGEGRLLAYGGWGPYEHRWVATGRQDFREFLCGVSSDYVYRKMTNHKFVYAAAATRQAVREAARLAALDTDEVEGELSEFDDLDDEHGFDRWIEGSEYLAHHLSDLWEFRREKREPGAEYVFFQLFPKLQAVLRAELEAK